MARSSRSPQRTPGPSARGLEFAIALAAFGAPLAAQSAERAAAPQVWEDVELPRGFGLELGNGLVTNRPGDAASSLVYAGGTLRSGADLRALVQRAEGGARLAIERGEGVPRAEAPAELGLELAFDLGDAGWGYLRVLDARPERVALEYALERRAVIARLERRPERLEARALETGVELAWSESQPAPERYRVERRVLRGTSATAWEAVGTPEHPPLLDPDAPRGMLLEYRVGPAMGDLETGLGARVRAAADLLPEEEPIRLARGARIDLLTGAMDGARVDLTVEFVGNKGAQLSTGPSVGMRLLNPIEVSEWELPGPEDGGYGEQRFFLTEDRALALALPEGLFARVRIESGEGGETLLYRQLDLAGGRVFPPPPAAPGVAWELRRGVVLHLPAGASGASAPAGWVVEREEGFQSGAWQVAAELTAGTVEWVDAEDPARALVRYRLRHALEGGRRSLPGPPATALLGDDGGAGTQALLQRALAEIADPSYDRRLRAEGVLTALGPRAWPELRTLLAAEDPEAVAAARRILARTVAGSPELAGSQPPVEAPELAPVILRARARALGLEAPPAGWLSERVDGRAMALLRDVGALPPGRIEPWRELIAAEDPDAGLRLLASVLGAWPSSRRSGPPAFAPRGGSGAGFDLSDFALGLADPEAAQRALESRLDPSDPWAAYVELQLLHALERARRDPLGAEAESELVERAALAASLLERRAAGDPGDVFLGAALEVVDDPVLRLKAAATLADLRFARASGPAGGDEAHPRSVIVLPAADAELLLAELDSLRDTSDGATDLVLPPGEYVLSDGRQGAAISCRGLRLFGEGRPVLRFGLVVLRDSDVVLEGLRLAPEAGSAVNVDRAACLLRDCSIEPPVLAAQGTDGVLELDRVDVELAADAPPLAGGIRLGRLSLLLARESRLAAGSGAISGARTAFLERCAVEGGERGAIDGRIDGELLMLDGFVRSRSDALSNVYAGALEGVVLEAGERAAVNPGPRLVVCPAHAAEVGPAGDWQDARRAERCLIGR